MRFSFFEEIYGFSDHPFTVDGAVNYPDIQEAYIQNWVTLSIFAGITFLLISFFFLFYFFKLKEIKLCRGRLRQSASDMTLMRRDMDDCKNLLSFSQPLSREKINMIFLDRLSDREIDVYMLLQKGLTNQKIADHLFVSVNTVKFHLQNIYVKLNVNNRADAILYVTRTS